MIYSSSPDVMSSSGLSGLLLVRLLKGMQFAEGEADSVAEPKLYASLLDRPCEVPASPWNK